MSARLDDSPRKSIQSPQTSPKADQHSLRTRALMASPASRFRLANLKVAIQLRAENRYHAASSDEDFVFLFQEYPLFTELLSPETYGSLLLVLLWLAR